MDTVSPLPAIASLLVAMATAFLLVKKFGAPPHQGRYASIDGLRGFLAFFVFLHHACIWYFFLHTGHWKLPPSNLYIHFGQSSILLFFMITGFLFFSKLIDGKTKKIDWGKLFISRVLRLVPLYFFTMFLLFLVVAYLSGWELNEPIPKLLSEIVQWLGFTIVGAPNLNGNSQTVIILAGVTWPLPIEWLFYLSLPVLALTVRVSPPLPYVAFSIACIVGLAYWGPQINPLILIPFLGGVAASFLVRWELFREFAGKKPATFISLGCLAIAIIYYPSAYGFVPLLLESAAFILIACGNNMFGLLDSPISRTLGEMAYSIYLLHAITLYVTFNFILGITASKGLSPEMYWLLIVGITPVLVLICFVTFRLIESPAMHSTTKFMAWLRTRKVLRF